MKPPAPPEPALHAAARTGDRAALERLVGTGYDVNLRADIEVDNGGFLRGLTPLMVAARSVDGANAQTLRWLLDHGADLRAQSESGTTAAWYAAGTGGRWWFHDWRLLPDHVDRLRVLLDAGLPVHECAGNGRSLVTEAAQSGDPARLRLLLERGAAAVPPHKPKHGPPDGFACPLFCAAGSGSAECVDLLLRAGAPVDGRDAQGYTPLMHAASIAAAQAMLDAGADPGAETPAGGDVLQIVLEGGACCGDSCKADCAGVARLLIARGADVNAIVGSFGQSRLASSAFGRHADAVDLLLAAGARPDDPSDRSPLMSVCWQGEMTEPEWNVATERIVRALVAAEANVNECDDEGNTPLHEAAGGDWGNATAIRVLLELGATVDTRNRAGWTALMFAADRGEAECIDLLLRAGADPRPALPLAKGHRDCWISLVAGAEDEQTARRHRETLAVAEACLVRLRDAAGKR